MRPSKLTQNVTRCVLGLGLMYVIVYGGARLLYDVEFQQDAALALAQLEEVNELTRAAWIDSLEISWAKEAFIANGLAPPPPPPIPDCLSQEVALDVLAKVDVLLKAFVARGAGVVSVFNLHWSFSGALFFMFTLQTTIGYGTSRVAWRSPPRGRECSPLPIKATPPSTQHPLAC